MNRNELINYIILNSKISLEDIAQNIGVNRSNIYLWRTNKTTPKIEYVNKMANLAGITLKWINQDEIIIDNIDSDNVEMKNDSSKDKIISLQDESIKLKKEKIEALERQLIAKSHLKIQHIILKLEVNIHKKQIHGTMQRYQVIYLCSVFQKMK